MAKRNEAHTTPRAAVSTGRLVDLKYVIDDLGIASPSSLYAMINAGRYPAPLKLGSRMSRWRIEDHEKFKAELVVQIGPAPRSPGRPRGATTAQVKRAKQAVEFIDPLS